MEVSYSLRFKKSSLLKSSVIDKEGEIIIYEKGFRIKGKGANDNGELLSFSEIKEFYHRDDKIYFVTFLKEKYVLLDAGTQINQIILDLYKSRNSFLIDALFMKKGSLKFEFDADFSRTSKSGKLINYGECKLKFYEKSLVVFPKLQDAFAVHYDFIKSHNFNDFDYTFEIITDDDLKITFSKLGNDFELLEEKVNTILGMLYADLVNNVFRKIFPSYTSSDLLKLAYKIKNGKTASIKEIKKINDELIDDLKVFFTEDESYLDKINYLSSVCNTDEVRYGFTKDSINSENYTKWCLFPIPSKNLVAICVLPRWEDTDSKSNLDFLFFKIIMEKGDPETKIIDKINEITQALVVLDFIYEPCYIEKKKLKHSPFQYATRKLPFLRILRKSFCGIASNSELPLFKEEVGKIMSSSEIL